MLPNGEYQMSIVNRLTFNRLGGSPEELAAAQIIQDEIASLGGTSHLEGFMMPWYTMHAQKVEITAPFTRSVACTGYGFCGSTPPVGIEAPLLYAERGTEINLRDAAGKIVLINEMSYDIWPGLVKSGALGFIVAPGEYDEDPETTDIPMNYLRPRHFKSGKLPGLTIRGRDAIALLQDGAERVRITVVQDEFERESHNVVSEIPGSDRASEIIAFTAHYDSVPYSKGAWDNATGTADILALYRYFIAHPPRRTLRFVWCGSEERGLLGSLAYVKAHQEEMERFRLCINADMTGPTLGFNKTIVTAGDALVHALEYQARECGIELLTSQTAHPSDSTPFADAGVPALTFNRWGRAAGHSRRDLASPLSASGFAAFHQFMEAFAVRMDAADAFPIPREISKEMKDALDTYFDRAKKE